MWSQKTSSGILCSVTQPSWFAILNVFWVMLQVKTPKAHKIQPEPAVLQQGDEVANSISVAQWNVEDKTSSTVLWNWHWNQHVM